jgi:hypothetical protein
MKLASWLRQRSLLRPRGRRPRLILETLEERTQLLGTDRK